MPSIKLLSLNKIILLILITIPCSSAAVGCAVATFESNKNKGTSEFDKYLASQSIRFIPSRRNNPQTNGKLERFWYEYDKHRWISGSLQDFLNWYKGRIHGSLDYMKGENTVMAFILKMPVDAVIGLFFAWSE